ncbi:MAG: type III-B CRISPR module RAMP protein Cmr1 [Deltaproteobacteria bacterium]|nr:type III-B CRISPR module RAMP protein Cmr1 [Deltaproteobacteria bacterium]
MIQKISFDLEVITPLFLSGSDQTAVELRAQSIRGQLRYWYRALLGGVGVTDLRELQELESDLFGSTERGSAFKLRVLRKGDQDQTPINNLNLGGGKPGITYLLFSAKMNRRSFIPVGTRFTIQISCWRNPRKHLQLAGCAVWCWVNLSGLGSRTRRGGGSLNVANVEGEEIDLLPSFTQVGNSPQLFQQYISSGLEKVRKLVASQNNFDIRPVSGKPSFPVLAPENLSSILVVNQVWDNWEKAMEEIGKKLMGFRRRRPPDYENIKNFISRGTTFNMVERSAFGLPIQFRYTSLGGESAIVDWKDSTASDQKKETRRASPLLIRFAKLAGGKYCTVLTFLRSQFLPNAERVRIKTKKGIVSLNQPSDNIVFDLVKEMGNLLPVTIR